jgi:chaperone modulatory protein CbpM
MIYSLTRPSRLDLTTLSAATGLHPDLLRRLVDLGLLDGRPGSNDSLSFTVDQIAQVARLQRLRAGFALNYAALGLVVDLLDRIAVLEATTPHRRARRPGGASWT